MGSSYSAKPPETSIRLGVVAHHASAEGTERLPQLLGRGRALEIVLGANDFDGETAERYGYVNRALPDTELDGFVDALARRIASFDRRPIAAAKNLVNQVSVPPAIGSSTASTFTTALTWPEAQRRFQALFNRGLNRPGEMENRFSRAAADVNRQLAAAENPRQIASWRALPVPEAFRNAYVDLSRFLNGRREGSGQGEVVTIPSLHNADDWVRFEADRRAIFHALRQLRTRFQVPGRRCCVRKMLLVS